MPPSGPRSNTPNLYNPILSSRSYSSSFRAGGESHNPAGRPLNLSTSVHFQHRGQGLGVSGQLPRMKTSNPFRILELRLVSNDAPPLHLKHEQPPESIPTAPIPRQLGIET